MTAILWAWKASTPRILPDEVEDRPAAIAERVPGPGQLPSLPYAVKDMVLRR